ncbi:hypothetical protein HZH68_014975 [Vespula germanica]|uniref:Uncharacterized protein n=1 Tax=Vespula germanica TaxID=30212 RepID=A0A834J8Q9_VESGE|nr:hypothetical protein HZH68_014975 [Vespula germanica]
MAYLLNCARPRSLMRYANELRFMAGTFKSLPRLKIKLAGARARTRVRARARARAKARARSKALCMQGDGGNGGGVGGLLDRVLETCLRL